MGHTFPQKAINFCCEKSEVSLILFLHISIDKLLFLEERILSSSLKFNNLTKITLSFDRIAGEFIICL